MPHAVLEGAFITQTKIVLHHVRREPQPTWKLLLKNYVSGMATSYMVLFMVFLTKLCLMPTDSRDSLCDTVKNGLATERQETCQ